MLKEKLVSGIKKLNLNISDGSIDNLLFYQELIVKWNKTHNLTAITDPTKMLSHHLLDSLSVLPYLEGERVIDVGTGAGLPGMVLAICDPSRQYFLLDSLQKRIHFLKHVAHKLSIKNVTVIDSRAENYQPEQKFDVIVSRAFSSLQLMVEYTSQLTHKNGLFLAMKGVYPEDEIKALPKNIVSLEKVVTCHVPTLKAERHLVLLRKE